MADVIYLSENQIQVISGDGGGKAAVKRCALSTEVGRCMFGGTVSDREAFVPLVTAFLAQCGLTGKSVTLVLNSSQIVTRHLTMPDKDEAGSRTYLANELADVERTEQPEYAYTVLAADHKTRLRRVLAAMASKSYVDGCADLFRQCGVTVKAVEPALFCAVRALRKTVEGKTCIVQLMEEKGMYQLLFVDGRYAFSNYSRLVSPHGSAEAGMEIARSVGNLLQFAKAQQIPQEITDVYFAGFSPRERETAGALIDDLAPGMGAGPLPEEKGVSVQAPGASFGGCVYGAGALLSTEKSASLYSAAAQREGKWKKFLTGRGRGVTIVAGLAVVLLLIFGVLKIQGGVLNHKLAAINDYLNSETVQTQTAQYDDLQAQLADQTRRMTALTDAEGLLASYPLPNSQVVQQLDSCAAGLAAVTVTEYDSATGVLTLDTKSQQVDDINQFIALLRQEDTFSVQQYSGYEYDETDGLWSVHVDLQLTENAGR